MSGEFKLNSARTTRTDGTGWACAGGFDERAAIVAWLNEKAEHGNPPYFADKLADAIERGEHLA